MYFFFFKQKTAYEMRISDRSSDVCSSDLPFGDSVYVRDGITKWVHGWQRNGWKTAAKKPVANADLWQRLIAEAARHDTEWLWVKGHAGHGDNEMADKLASDAALAARSEEHTSELQSLMRISYAVFCLKKKNNDTAP